MSKSGFLRINNQINSKQVKLVDADSKMLGVFDIFEAIKRARELNLDLVEITPHETEPVCKIMDYNKFRYESKKKKQESKKKQKITTLKEMRFRPNIGVGDFEIKVRNIKKFLEHGDKVKVLLTFSGREIIYKEGSIKLLDKITEIIGEAGKVELGPKSEGMNMIMVLTPR